MAQRLSLEEKLARLGELEGASPTPEIMQQLLTSLADSSNIVITKAAQVMGASDNPDCIAPLVASFNRLLPQGAAGDKTCRAKEAIIQALDALGCLDPDPFLAGIRHVQMEPVFGGRVDTAANLRGHCAVALARTRYPETHFALTRLLVDPEPQPRLAAVQALTYLACEQSELLLRLKVLTGDPEPEVLGKCFAGLITIEPERSLPFTAEFLPSADAILAEQAALALGASHLESAFALLRDYWDRNVDYTFNKTLLVAIALTRCDSAVDFLLALIRSESRSTACKAVEALAIYAADPRQRERIYEAVRTNGDPKVYAVFLEEFGG